MRIGQQLLAILLTVVFGTAMAESPVLTLTISTNNTPHDRKALQALSAEAFRRAGVEFKLISLPSERSLHLANQGEVDGEGLRIAGLGNQYPNLIQVPERYIGISFVAFAKDKTIKLDHGWDSLPPYSVAFITGWKLFEANTVGARKIYKVDKAEQIFSMLDSGRVDLALYTRDDGIVLLRSMGLSSIMPLSPALKDVDMYLYLHKKHEALVPKLTRVLREMKAYGSYNRIVASLKVE